MTRTLDAIAYWKLRAKCTEAQRAAVVAAQARDVLIAAQKAQAAELVALGLDPNLATFALDDDAFTLTIPDN